eukprot:1160058-Pelagomonas_calceolata.AAC.4
MSMYAKWQEGASTLKWWKPLPSSLLTSSLASFRRDGEMGSKPREEVKLICETCSKIEQLQPIWEMERLGVDRIDCAPEE